MIEGYPLLMPLAGFGTIVLMGLGIYFLLRRYSKKQLDKIVNQLNDILGRE